MIRRFGRFMSGRNGILSPEHQPNASATSAQTSRKAYHERTWRDKNYPDKIPAPRKNCDTIKVRVVVLGTSPDAQPESVVNMLNYGDVDKDSNELGMFSYLPEYLCQDDVYALDVSELPQPAHRLLGVLSMYRHFAFVIIYNVTSLVSFQLARDQLNTILSKFDNESGYLPLPILLLGLTTNLASNSGALQSWQNPRRVLESDAKAQAEAKGCLFTELSARNQADVINAFGSIVENFRSNDTGTVHHSEQELGTQVLMASCLSAVAGTMEAQLA